MKKNVVELFQRARRAATPLVAISTSDQNAMARMLYEAVGNGDTPPPKLQWDVVRGIVAANESGEAFLAAQGIEPDNSPRDIVTALEVAMRLPPQSLLVLQTAQRFLGDAAVMQAVYNLRDAFSQDRRTLVMLSPSFNLPSELKDVVVLDETLPSDEMLIGKLRSLYEHAYDRGDDPLLDEYDPLLDESVASAAASAARGLSMFAAEQLFAMSLTKDDGIDMNDAWIQKRAAVNQTRGLKFSLNGPTFDDLGGLDGAKEFINTMMDGPEPPAVIVFVDEVEKAIAGSAGSASDSSGVSQDFLLNWLTWMEDNEHDGLIAIGPPGSGKTAFGKAIGATHGIPTVSIDMGGLKGSLVGESETNLREALKVIDTLAGENGRAFVFATCNSEADLPAEFKRRFVSGEWFFDLPTEEEREAIWNVHLSNYEIDTQAGRMVNDEGWTGAEIRNCCRLSRKHAKPLREASQYIVPVVRSAAKTIRSLQEAAVGRWLSASLGETCTATKDPRTTGRKVDFA